MDSCRVSRGLRSQNSNTIALEKYAGKNYAENCAENIFFEKNSEKICTEEKKALFLRKNYTL